MSKAKSVFVCQSCGYESLRWMGRCPACGEWNSLVEVPRGAKGKSTKNHRQATLVKLSEVKGEERERYSTGIDELDRVLGGGPVRSNGRVEAGLVPGGVVLLAGEPGIGKSTLLLQLATSYPCLSASNPHQSLLYVCGEESPGQIKIRAKRLGVGTDNLLLLPTTDVDEVLEVLNKEKGLSLVVVDSIQTMATADLSGTAGSVGQVRESAARLIDWAKHSNVPLVLVGHVTKEGNIAGPKVLEHAVDTVVYFEGDQYGQLRLLRATKNRFGRTGEVGVFRMSEKGLIAVTDPSSLFLANEKGKEVSGAVKTVVLEGTRPLILEVQAIATRSNLMSPRRLSHGVNRNRLQLYTAVLQKHLRLPLYKEDVILNVAGGIRVEEPAIDLACCLAIWSSYRDKVIPQDWIAFGEIGLLGEVRKVREEEKRNEEARRLGYKKIISARNTKSLQEAIGKISSFSLLS